MLLDSYSRTMDIAQFEERYPYFNKVKGLRDYIYRGNFPLISAKGILVHNFLLEIHFVKNYPFVFPQVREIGNQIPKILDRHIFPSSGQFCLATSLEEFMICQRGLNSIIFMEKILIPRLADEFIVMNGGRYPKHRDLSHGIDGVYESYRKLLNLKSKEEIILFIELLLGVKVYHENIPCFCDSVYSYKRCHKNIINELPIDHSRFFFWLNQLENLYKN